MKKLRIGIVGIVQNNFTGNKQKNFDRGIEKINQMSKKLDFDIWAYDKLIVTNDDALVFKNEAKDKEIDLLILMFASFGSGEIMTFLLNSAPYLGLWALDEPNKDGVLAFNSFCGVNMYAANLKHYYRTVAPLHKWFYGVSEMFEKRLQVTVCALRAIKNMKGAKVGLIGGIVPGFNDLYFDERLIREKLGIEISRNNEMDDIISLANSYKDSDLKNEIDIVTNGYNSINEKVLNDIEKNARFYKAFMEWSNKREFEAVAIACWPKLQDKCDMLACSTIAKLNENGLPAACEGDLIGAVSMLILKYATLSTTMLMDLVAFDTNDESVQMWHCGPAANCFANEEGSCLDCFYEQQGETLNRRNGMHNMTFAASEATVMRITDECEKMFLANGKFNPNKPTYFGSGGWISNIEIAGEKTNSLDFVETVLTNGIPHHFPIVFGDVTDVMLEIGAWLNIKTEEIVTYKDNLQNK